MDSPLNFQRLIVFLIFFNLCLKFRDFVPGGEILCEFRLVLCFWDFNLNPNQTMLSCILHPYSRVDKKMLTLAQTR